MGRTASEKRYQSCICLQGCIVCYHQGKGIVAAVPHHIRSVAGAGQKAPEFLVIPLCPEHHTGENGYHRSPSLFQMRYGTEFELLNKTIDRLWEML